MEKNSIISGFLVQDEYYLSEIDSNVFIMLHQKSGAKLLFLQNKDDNKVFSVSFRTPPYDNTGIAHILEHSVLCGSRKYPLKEPFVELVKGSLNTFLNAMTFPDKTMYPIASRNQKDFFNLMDVYLDAVFYPNIYQNKYTLEQEGWHYELLGKDVPLEYKGVVYNEMKGVFSSPDAILEYEIMKALFPESPYGFESGGYPDDITKLNQESFEQFHAQYYHPSNSYIFLYGDLDIEKTLAFLDKEYLSEFSKIAINSQIKSQLMLAKTVKIEADYPLEANQDAIEKAFLSWSAVVGNAKDIEKNFAFELLCEYLLETPASPLKKALIDAKIGKEVSGQFTKSIAQPVFSIKASGADEQNKDKFVSIIYKTLQEITINGIDKNLMTACLNKMEFHLREADFGSYPKGLVYAIQAMDTWLYDANPTLYLSYDKIIQSLKEKINTRYFEGLIENYLLDNTHRAVVLLMPNQLMQEKKEKADKLKLENIKQDFTQEQLDEIIENTDTLMRLQDAVDEPETLAKIPLLDRDDIKRKLEKQTHVITDIDNIKYLYLDKFTNKIAYVRLCFDAQAIPAELVPYTYLLGDILGKISTQNYTYEQLSQEIDANTGGISFGLAAFSSSTDANMYQAKFIVAGKSLVEKADKLCSLMQEIFTNSLFTNQKRLQELLAEKKTQWDAEFFARGQSIITARTAAYFSEIGKYNDQGLLSYYRFLNEAQTMDIGLVQERLMTAVFTIFSKYNLLACYCCEKKDQEQIQGIIGKVFSDLKLQKNFAEELEFEKIEKNEGITTTALVQYVAVGGNFIKHGYTYSGQMKVLENIMRYDYLWNKIRVKGGAYGAFFKMDYNGNVVMNSYRDPNLEQTIKVFKQIPDYLKAFSASEREMTKYIIGTISQMDKPLTPVQQLDQAITYYLRQITEQLLQTEREQIIYCTKDEINDLQKLMQDIIKDNYYCVLGNESKIKEQEEIFNKIFSALPKKD